MNNINNDDLHEKIAQKTEDVSMTVGIVAGASALVASISAPTGLSAIGVTLGIISPPLIVTVSPIIGAAATFAGVASGATYFYSKWKRNS